MRAPTATANIAAPANGHDPTLPSLPAAAAAAAAALVKDDIHVGPLGVSAWGGSVRRCSLFGFRRGPSLLPSEGSCSSPPSLVAAAGESRVERQQRCVWRVMLISAALCCAPLQLAKIH